MANAVLTKFDALQAFTITLNSVADAASNQSALVSNSSNRPAAIVYVKIMSATAPALGQSYEVFLIRSNGTNYASDGAAAGAGALAPLNARFLGGIFVTASANTTFYGEFDTSFHGPLGAEFGIIIRNSSGQTTDSTAGNHYAGYRLYYPEIQ